ncbi:phosphoethanolamine transferase [Paludibacterium paludis]|nr:phosphoethanolamine transferase [Paludibacterium paludis]
MNLQKYYATALMLLIGALPFLFVPVSSLAGSSGLVETNLKIFLFGVLSCFMLALAWRKRYGKFLVLPVIVVMTLCTTLSVACRALYGGEANLFAVDSVLSSNLSEAWEMMSSHLWIVVLGIGLLVGHCVSIAIMANVLPVKWLRRGGISFLLLLAVQHGWYLRHNGREHYPIAVLTLTKTPLFNVGHVLRLVQDRKEIGDAVPPPVHFDAGHDTSSIDTFVIVLGESARRKQLALYGYGRDTSPRVQADAQRMIIFDKAHSAAPVTTIAVPLSLSRVVDKKGSPDNILRIANMAGFGTYWLSRQDKYGVYDNKVTALARFAREKTWIGQGNDEALLPHLRQALAKPGKKLIVLHLTGSHVDACKRYPQQAAYFQDGADINLNCYDNSVRYTDMVLGSIFDVLRTRNASLMYFSDHGQEWEALPDSRFYHGAVSPSKEAYEVPMFIWYSPVVSASERRTGRFHPNYSTAFNYYLIRHWMGIADPRDRCLSVLEPCFKGADPDWVLDGNNQPLQFDQLPASKRIVNPVIRTAMARSAPR